MVVVLENSEYTFLFLAVNEEVARKEYRRRLIRDWKRSREYYKATGDKSCIGYLYNINTWLKRNNFDDYCVVKEVTVVES